MTSGRMVPALLKRIVGFWRSSAYERNLVLRGYLSASDHLSEQLDAP